MADTVQVDLVTPERHFASTQAVMVEVPGGAGDFGVLPGHAPLISDIRPGVVTIHLDGGTRQRFLVMGGVAEVTPERCVILAEYLEDVSGTTRDQAASRLGQAKQAGTAAVSDEEKRVASRNLQIAEALAASLEANAA